MAAVGSSLNRLVSATITAADLAAQGDWLAVNIDNTFGNVVLIDGLDFHVNAVGADLANLTIVTVQIVKNAQFTPGQPIGAQLGAGIETYYSTIAAGASQRTVDPKFTEPIVLETGGKYVIWGRAFYTVFAGPVGYELTAMGRIVNASGKTFPLEPR